MDKLTVDAHVGRKRVAFAGQVPGGKRLRPGTLDLSAGQVRAGPGRSACASVRALRCGSWARLWLALVVSAAVVLGGFPGAAWAGSHSWSAPIGLDAPPSRSLDAVACPSAHQCTAVDDYGREVTFGPTSPGIPTPIAINGDHQALFGVACPSVRQCTAIDGTREVTFDPRSPGSPTPRMADRGDRNYLQGVACPSVSQCTAVDFSGREVTFDPRSPGISSPVSINGGDALAAVACVGEDQCTAVDLTGREVTFDPRSPGTPTPTQVNGGIRLLGLACPSLSQCTAVDLTGREVTFDPRSPGMPASLTVVGGGALTGVACPSAGQCTAVDVFGLEVTFDPRSPGAPTPVMVGAPAPESAGPFGAPPRRSVSGVACVSAGQCTAVDQQGTEVTFDPRSPGGPTQTSIEPCQFGIHSGCVGPGLEAVACPAVAQCTAVDDSGREVTFDPRAPGNPTLVTVDSGHVLTGVACPSVVQCTAVDYSGREVTFDPRSPGNPTPSTIKGRHQLRAVACPSAGQCTAVGTSGLEVTFDPRSPGIPVPAVIDRGNGLNGVACPSASQCTAVDGAGRQVTFDPAATDIPAPTVVDRGNELNGVACLSTSDCVVVDGAGRAVEGDPQRSGAWTVGPIARAASLTAVACSSVSQCVAGDQIGQGFVGTMQSVTSSQLSSSARSSLAGQQVTFTAAVSPPQGGGSIRFTAEGRTIPSCAAVALSASTGKASCAARFAKPGFHRIRATYTGDARFAGSQTSVLTQTVRSSVTVHGSPSGNAGVVRVRLDCTAHSGGCHITAVLSTIKTVRGGRPVAVSARARGRTVILASKTMSIADGRTVMGTITLNAVGRKLLAKFKRLPVKLTITLTVDRQRSIVAIRKLTVTR